MGLSLSSLDPTRLLSPVTGGSVGGAWGGDTPGKALSNLDPTSKHGLQNLLSGGVGTAADIMARSTSGILQKGGKIGQGVVTNANKAAPYVGAAVGGYEAYPLVAGMFGGTAAPAAAPAADGALSSAPTDMLMASPADTTAASDAVSATQTASTAGTTAKGLSTAQKIALGVGGVNALMQKKQGLNPTLMGAATPSQDASNKILAQYQSGQLNASDQYSIAKWAQDTKASKQDYYAKSGLSDSSMATQDIAQVDAQAGAMRDQALQNMLQGGLAAAGIANTAIGNAVDLQMQQDQQAQQAQQQFFEMLAFTMA